MSTATPTKRTTRKPAIDRSRGATVAVPSKHGFLVMAVTDGREEFLTILSWDEGYDVQHIETQAKDWAASHGGDDGEKWTYAVYEIGSVTLTGKRVVKARRGAV